MAGASPPTTATPACRWSSCPTLWKVCRRRRSDKLLKTRSLMSSAPSAPSIDPLASAVIEVDDDPIAFYELSLRSGWGDGLPVVPPTEERVRAMLAGTPYHADDVVAVLPPG